MSRPRSNWQMFADLGVEVPKVSRRDRRNKQCPGRTRCKVCNRWVRVSIHEWRAAEGGVTCSTCEKGDSNHMQVGDIVEVLHVRGLWTPGGDTARFWPVMGSFHTDESLNFEPLHYHVDYRFLTESEAEKTRDMAELRYIDGATAIVTACYHTPLMGRLIIPEGEDDKNEDLCRWSRNPGHYRRQNHMIREWLAGFPKESYMQTIPRKYRRPWPGCPGQDKLRQKLYFEYRDARLDLATMACPHRGVDLSGIEPDDQGVIHCPGHGLRFCARSGQSIWYYNDGKKGGKA